MARVAGIPGYDVEDWGSMGEQTARSMMLSHRSAAEEAAPDEQPHLPYHRPSFHEAESLCHAISESPCQLLLMASQLLFAGSRTQV